MVGHVKDGYEGYNSTPSSPTKYTVNRGPSAVDSNKTWIVSRLCILLTAVSFVLSLLTVFLITYYLLGKKCPLDEKPIENGHELRPNCSHLLEMPTKTFDLTGDVLQIDVMDDDTNNVMVTTDALMPVEEESEDKSVMYRLPKSVVPITYRIKIIPFMESTNLTTYGETKITIKCLNKTDQIRLNVKDLSINDEDVNVFSEALSKELKIKSIRNLIEYEQLEINLEESLLVNEEYSIWIKYTGKIRNVPNGFYRSEFIDTATKEKKWIFSTLFSPTYARHVYPSFDEPSFKAKFTISIARPFNMMTFSNMNVSHTEPIQGMDAWMLDHYNETPLMSTYLVAFLIAPKTALMQNKADRTQSPEIKMWARPDGISQTQLPTVFSEKILSFLEGYLESDFPLSKIDIIGVPTLDYNAMENWGLVIFREGALLVDEANSVKMQQSLALMMAHELSHQWFGNLVTPTWWDDLWLKESLSTYFQCLVIDNIKPNWLVFDTFILNEMNSAFQMDALMTSPSVSRNVTIPNKEIFDTISYHKGSAIIRMMASFMDAKALKSGLISYLNEYKYSNANQEDLWNSLDAGTGLKYNDGQVTSLKTIMDSWTLQAGYPIVNIVKKNGTIKLSQERFLLNFQENNEQLWWVPVSYTAKDTSGKNYNDTIPKIWLPAQREIIIKDTLPANSFILANLRTTGFYRVNYDYENWLLLIDSYSDLPQWTRAQLVTDSLNLARAGKLSYDIAFGLTNKLANEKEYLPWEAAMDPFRYLRNALIKMPLYGNFRKYIILILMRAYESTYSSDNDIVPWKIPDEPVPQMFAENIIGMACLVEYTHCVSNSLELFESWRRSPDDNNNIPETIRSIVYCTAIRKGPSKNWEFAYEKLLNISTKGAKYTVEKNNLIMSLGCASEQWLLTRTLGLIVKPNSGLTIEEGVQLFHSVAENNVGHWIAISFIRAQWKRLLEFYNNPPLLYEMINCIVLYINTPYDVILLKNLVKEIKNYTQEESQVLRQAIETAENNILWSERNYGSIQGWMETFQGSYKQLLSNIE